MLINALILLCTCVPSSEPAFVAARNGRSVSDLLGRGFRAAQEQPLGQVAGLRGAFAAIVVVADDPDGEPRPAGLLVYETQGRARAEGRLELLAAADLDLGPAYDDVTLAPERVDLDGDGVPELAVDERVGAGDLRIRSTTYWRLGAAPDGTRTLTPAYHIAREYACRDRTEQRAHRRGGPGVLLEKVSVVEGDGRGGERSEEWEVELRWDRALGRFIRAPW